MTKKQSLLLLFAFVLSLSSNAQKIQPLFNGKNLSNWDLFIGTALKGFDELKKDATPEKTYSIVEQDGEKLLRISGEVNAALATKEAYENYHFHLEFKWGESVYTSRNSGLLYHSYEPFGAGLGTWMSSIELQLMHENMGDAYMMGNTYAEIQVSKDGDNQLFSEEGRILSFGNEQNGGKIARKKQDMEKSVGKWNVVDLYCIGNKSIHVINGTKVMACENIGKLVNGQVLGLNKGKIQLQSEGAELFVRQATIEKINVFPTDL